VSILSDRIRQERQYVGYSIDEMATKLGITPAEFAAFEEGEIEPTDAQLSTIARLCGTTPDRLRGEDLRADPRVDQLLRAKRLTHEDAYEVHRFAEYLRHAPRDDG
jgi:transcriptional regulator with XRE-family HTH domain